MVGINGYIKLFRSLLDSAVFENEKLLKTFIWCLLKASHQPFQAVVGNQVVDLQPGQFVFGRNIAAKELNMNESAVYRNMQTLQKLDIISINANNKFSVVSIVNWRFYQIQEGKSEQQMNNKRTADEQQMNTYKKGKKGKNNTAFGKPIIEPPNYRRLVPDEPVQATRMPEEMRKKFRLD